MLLLDTAICLNCLFLMWQKLGITQIPKQRAQNTKSTLIHAQAYSEKISERKVCSAFRVHSKQKKRVRESGRNQLYQEIEKCGQFVSIIMTRILLGIPL